MEAMEFLRGVAADPHAYARKWKSSGGGRVVGYFCTYTPDELIRAAGCLPFRIFGSGGNMTRADAHLQSYSCSLVRGGLEEALSGRLDFLDATVFPHTCDSIQRLSDIWRLSACVPLHFDVVLPVKLNTASAGRYMVDVFKKFRSDLEGATGTGIDAEKISEEIRNSNRMKRILAGIYEARSADPLSISGGDVYSLIKSSMVMDRGEFIGLAEEVLAGLGPGASAGAGSLKRIVLAGGICSHPDVYSILERSGAHVVWDELCTGTRYFEGEISEKGDPVESLAARYMDRIVCPAKHSDIYARGKNIVRIARERKADGVIFILLKFCDPHAFDYPYMKESLDAGGIPSILLEIEEKLPPEGQLLTRLETFVSTL
ncbi:MAG: 2-hydroxyacyl-CoA dehydratase family protein [Spirochaetes bacterium]|jgi:bcr-type benzoyl-CoA reductase subunit C|nr:2-hydroxyacyl-CoA dehydratase family protein [Spirochaetota bacterium]